MLGSFFHNMKQLALQKGWLIPLYNSTCRLSAVALSKTHYLANQCGLVNPFTHPEAVEIIDGSGIEALNEYFPSCFLPEGLALTKNVTDNLNFPSGLENAEYILAGISECMNDPSKIVASYVPSFETAIVMSAVAGATFLGSAVAVAVNCARESKKQKIQ